jgi:ketosteroid isomerase-like protein
LEEACDPRRVALIVYDMQVGILRHIERSADLIANVVRVLMAARQAGVRVFFMRHRSLPKELTGVFQLRMAMADSPNVSVIRRLYQARGNPDVIRQVLASDVRWEVVDGFPYGAVYVGLDSVLRDFFGRLFTDFDEFVANGAEFFESGDHVIALGSYAGRARRTGKRFTARFTHVWTL